MESVFAWYEALHPWQVNPNPTLKMLKDLVLYKPKECRNNRRRACHHGVTRRVLMRIAWVNMCDEPCLQCP